MNQASLFQQEWIESAIALPDPGQRVLLCYMQEDGTVSMPVTGTPIHADGSHPRSDGTSIYQPLACWMPIPELPGGVYE